MRLIGHLNSDLEARTFGDFLYVQGIETQFEEDGPRWAIWVKSDDDLARAGKLLEEFRANPTDPRYLDGSPAEKLRQKTQAEDEAYRRRMITGRKLFPGLASYGFGIVTYVLVAGCVTVFILSRMGEDIPRIANLLITEGGRGLTEIKRGQVWRLISPIFIHFGALHIIFNMLILRDLGSLFEARLGSGYFALFVVVTAAVSNYAQYAVTHHPLFGGMSGVVYGLIGYCWIRGRFDPAAGVALNRQAWIESIIWFAAGFIFFRHFIANYAHAGGLIMGMAWAFIDSKRRSRVP
jgi:GlpG protein